MGSSVSYSLTLEGNKFPMSEREDRSSRTKIVPGGRCNRGRDNRRRRGGAPGGGVNAKSLIEPLVLAFTPTWLTSGQGTSYLRLPRLSSPPRESNRRRFSPHQHGNYLPRQRFLWPKAPTKGGKRKRRRVNLSTTVALRRPYDTAHG